MGRYMRISKATGDLAATEVAQSSLGVRTRAKTQALLRKQQSVVSGGCGGSYLELRSRKLEKSISGGGGGGSSRQRLQRSVRRNPSPNFESRASSRLSGSSNFAVENLQEEVGSQSGCEKLKDCDEIGVCGVGDFDAFFGENSPDFHAVDRSTRESTPCGFVRDPDHVKTPGSATKPPSSIEISKRLQKSQCTKLIPTAMEIEEFFAGTERQQHKKFIEKYNFDPVNEQPLPGRYDWEKINPAQESPALLFSGKN